MALEQGNNAEKAEKEIEKTVEQLDSLKEQLRHLSVDKEKSEEQEEDKDPAENRLEERISFFPSRREIVVDQPAENTRGILSNTTSGG